MSVTTIAMESKYQRTNKFLNHTKKLHGLYRGCLILKQQIPLFSLFL